jgi:hypothetical protein
MKAVERHLPVDPLKVDFAYQRPLNRAKVREIVAEFKPSSLGTIHVSQRDDGSMWIVDGQTRVAAVQTKFTTPQTCRCLVYTGLSLAEEAELFYQLNSGKQVTQVYRFRARVLAGEAVASDIVAIAGKHGLSVGKGNGLACVRALETIYKGLGKGSRVGPQNLDYVLGIAVAAYGHGNMPDSQVLMGVALLTERYWGAVDDARLVKKIANYPGGHAGLLGAARGRSPSSGGRIFTAVAEILLERYNAGLLKTALR